MAINFFDYASFSPRHPNFVGMVDGVRDDDYDVVLCLGYRPNTRANPTDERFPRALRIGVGHDPRMLGNTFALDISLWANVKSALVALNALWNPADANLHQISGRKSELRDKSEARLEKMHNDSAGNAQVRPIHPNYLAHRMGECLAPRSMVVSENFSPSDQYMPFGPDEDDWKLVRTYGGSLGYGLGGAIGAQLGAPERPLVLSIGDGSVMYSSSGFWTMARYGLPIVTVVWNNMQYQTVRNNFARWGGSMKAQNRYPETFLGDPAIDFVLLAKAQGIEGRHVNEPDELDDALEYARDAQASGEPYVLDVHITNVGPGADQSWYKAFKLAK